jgi:hypothetical protein
MPVRLGVAFTALLLWDQVPIRIASPFSLRVGDWADFWFFASQSDAGLNVEMDVRNFVDGPDGIPDASGFSGPPHYMIKGAEYVRT